MRPGAKGAAIAVGFGPTGNGMSPWNSMDGRHAFLRWTSRKTRECHLRFCEGLWVKFPRSTRHPLDIGIGHNRETAPTSGPHLARRKQSPPSPGCYAPTDACQSRGTANHTYAESGTYTAQLVTAGPSCQACNDLNGRQRLDTVTITVTSYNVAEPQTPPTVGTLTFTASPTSGSAPLAVTFTSTYGDAVGDASELYRRQRYECLISVTVRRRSGCNVPIRRVDRVLARQRCIFLTHTRSPALTRPQSRKSVVCASRVRPDVSRRFLRL